MLKGNKATKSLLALALSVAMVLGLTACGDKAADTKPADTSDAQTEATTDATETPAEDSNEGPFGIKYAEDQTLRLVYGAEMSTLRTYGGEGTAVSWQGISNCISAFVCRDCYGNIQPDMAESWDISDDGMEYTFHLRKDMVWSDVEGNDMGPITAKDFQTAVEYCCDPENGVTDSSLLLLKNYKALIDPEDPNKDISTLGFEVIDDYTIKVTLEEPVPYFINTFNIFPVPTDYFLEMGEDYGMDNESIYYCGPYIMTTFEPQEQRIYEINPNYWDLENVHIEKIIMKYNAEAATLAPEMFKRGEIDYADIGTEILDEWMSADDTKDIVIPGLPDTTYMYYYSFCYNPQFDEEYEPENYMKAINNENFRQSIFWGLDRRKAYLCLDPYNPDQFLTNSVTPRTWCSINGTDYVDLADMKEITNRPNNSFDPDKAKEYKEKAVEELTAAGVTFPVKLYMPYNPNTTGWDKEVQVVKQQLEELLGSDYIECIIEAGPATGFLTEVRRSGKYGFMKLNNGANEGDPCSWVKAFVDGANWNFMGDVLYDDIVPTTERTGSKSADNADLQDLVSQYYELLDAAKAITVKSQERYDAFAKAENFLINHAFVIPYAKDTYGYHVTRTNPFEQITGQDGRYKYMHVLEEPLTQEQYVALYADWQEKQAESLK